MENKVRTVEDYRELSMLIKTYKGLLLLRTAFDVHSTGSKLLDADTFDMLWEYFGNVEELLEAIFIDLGVSYIIEENTFKEPL